MTTTEQQHTTTYEQRAYEMGVQHAKNGQADDPTPPASLLHDCLPAGYMNDPDADPVADGTMEAICDAYERGVDEIAPQG